MQRVIIFEGPDKVGKTQIAQELSRRIGVPYFKNENEAKNFLDPKSYFVDTLRYADPYFISFLKQTGHSAIIDRHYMSEWVYANVFKRETDIYALHRTDQAMADMRAVMVICYRSDYVGKKDDLFPEMIDSERLQKLHDEYLRVASTSKMQGRILWLNVDDENLNREVDDLLGMLYELDHGYDIDGHLRSHHEYEMAVTTGTRLDTVDGEDDPYDDADEDLDDLGPDVDESDLDPVEWVPGVGLVKKETTPKYPNPDLDWSDVDWKEGTK